MSIISNNVSKVKAVILSLLVALLFTTSAFALGSTSTAKLDFSRSATGSNINIWDGYASMTNNISFVGASIYGGEGAVSATIKKSVSVLPDPTVYNKNYTTTGTRTISKVSIPEASSYYAASSALGFSNATIKVTSLD